MFLVLYPRLLVLSLLPLPLIDRLDIQDSDQLWQLSPPARSALEVVLAEPSAALKLGWAITRTAPLASTKGGPVCEGEITVQLAGETRMQLLEVRAAAVQDCGGRCCCCNLVV